ncbi:hypothetical protein [Sinosporangium album]|uniref:hypothetical protein n=1 Tax=Sinosporangium album TaxID=504805 RepID=UPI0015A1413F|nr:hypothetical protein [Sinosporangium album]
MRTHSNPVRQGLVMAGVGLPGVVIVGAVMANIGNPALFVFRRDTWKEMLGYLKGSAWDVWLVYFSDISPNWKGHAVETFQQYLRFKLIGMFDQLGAIAKEMNGTMHSQYKEVLEYDLSALTLMATSAPVFGALKNLSAHPLGRVALIAQAGAFITAAGNLIKQFADIYTKYESALNDLETKAFDLKGLFYVSGNPAMGPRDLNMSPQVANTAYWAPVNEETA